MDLIFLSGNAEKVREVKEILGSDINIIQVDVDLKETQAIEGNEDINDKANLGYEKLKKPFIVEDTSLYINAWNRFPGALNKWFTKTVGLENIIRMLSDFEDKTAIAETIVAYHDGSDLHIFEGKVNGKISTIPRGGNGFGWDKIFIPEGQHKTQAEMTTDEKNKISTRKVALEKLREYLLKQ